MKLLILNWQDIKNPLAGGAEVHLHEVFSRIARSGHEVTLYCSAFPGSASEEVIDGIRVLREGGRHFFNYRVPAAYRGRLARTSFDVVIDDMNKIPFFTPLYVRTPLVCVTHHLFGGSIFKETNPLLASYVCTLERLGVALFASRNVPFIVGSPSTRDELIRKGCNPESVHVVYYAVDHRVHRVTGVPKSPSPMIGYFGRLKRYKNVDHLLRAVPLLRERIPELKVVIAGDGDDRVRLQKLARKLDLDRSVEFTGFIAEQRKVDLLQQMWCKVTTSSKEGWGLTVLEANACGTPVVASNVQGLRDAVRDGETGLLYAYGDIADLTEKVHRVLTDSRLRQSLSKSALEYASTFTWEKAAEATLDILDRARR